MTGTEIIGNAWLWLTATIGHAVILIGAYAAARRFLDLANRQASKEHMEPRVEFRR